jgi:hypothetical protein
MNVVIGASWQLQAESVSISNRQNKKHDLKKMFWIICKFDSFLWQFVEFYFMPNLKFLSGRCGSLRVSLVLIRVARIK